MATKKKAAAKAVEAVVDRILVESVARDQLRPVAANYVAVLRHRLAVMRNELAGLHHALERPGSLLAGIFQPVEVKELQKALASADALAAELTPAAELSACHPALYAASLVERLPELDHLKRG